MNEQELALQLQSLLDYHYDNKVMVEMIEGGLIPVIQLVCGENIVNLFLIKGARNMENALLNISQLATDSGWVVNKWGGFYNELYSILYQYYIEGTNDQDIQGTLRFKS